MRHFQTLALSFLLAAVSCKKSVEPHHTPTPKVRLSDPTEISTNLPKYSSNIAFDMRAHQYADGSLLLYSSQGNFNSLLHDAVMITTPGDSLQWQKEFEESVNEYYVALDPVASGFYIQNSRAYKNLTYFKKNSGDPYKVIMPPTGSLDQYFFAGDEVFATRIEEESNECVLLQVDQSSNTWNEIFRTVSPSPDHLYIIDHLKFDGQTFKVLVQNHYNNNRGSARYLAIDPANATADTLAELGSGPFTVIKSDDQFLYLEKDNSIHYYHYQQNAIVSSLSTPNFEKAMLLANGDWLLQDEHLYYLEQGGNVRWEKDLSTDLRAGAHFRGNFIFADREGKLNQLNLEDGRSYAVDVGSETSPFTELRLIGLKVLDDRIYLRSNHSLYSAQLNIDNN